MNQDVQNVKELLKLTQCEAEQIIAAAKREADEIKHSAKAAAAEDCDYVLEHARQRARKIIEQSERAIAEMVGLIAKEVLGRELQTQPEAIVARIKRAISFAINESKLEVVVNTSDYDCVKSALLKRESSFSSVSVDVTKDDGISKGDARVLGSSCRIESNLSSHLDSVTDAVLSNKSFK